MTVLRLTIKDKTVGGPVSENPYPSPEIVGLIF